MVWLGQAFFQLSDEVECVLHFLFVERRRAGVGGGIEDALGAGQDVVDEFDLFQPFDVFRGNQFAEAISIRLQSSFGGRIQGGVAIEIGIVRGDGIVCINGTVIGACTALLETLITPGREIVTIIEGSQATASTTEALSAWLADEHGDVQVEIHRGGQPLYPYLFGVE